jgi:hypothetical protein
LHLNHGVRSATASVVAAIDEMRRAMPWEVRKPQRADYFSAVSDERKQDFRATH